MLSFQLGNPASADYASLSPRDFFFYESVADDQALGLVLPCEDEEILRVLTLTGKDAYIVRDFERVYNHHVLPIKVEMERIRLRVDPAATHLADPKHQLGRLVVGSHRAPAIEVQYAPDRRQPSDRTVSLKDWSLGNMREPRFAFPKWSLSYLDDSVDLVA